jgi:hypothetical protein
MNENATNYEPIVPALQERKPAKYEPVMPSVPERRPTKLEVFLGYYFDSRDKLFGELEKTDKLILEKNLRNEDADYLLRHRDEVQRAINTYQLTPKLLWLYQWSLVLLLVLTSLTEALFIQLYCLWHGANFFTLSLYDPRNVDTLSRIGFVNGATTMSVAAEVMMWSSLGIWAQQSYRNIFAMLNHKFRFVHDSLGFTGIMMRNTSVAAIIVIILRLTKFSLFGVSLDETSPLAFDATIGLSFLLGFFGKDSYTLLSKLKKSLFGKANDTDDED